MRIYSNRPPVGQAPYCAIQDDRRVSGLNTQEKVVEARKTAMADIFVDVSGKSNKLSNIMATIDRLPDLRDSKVHEIKQRSETGMYTIDPLKIVEKMLRRL